MYVKYKKRTVISFNLNLKIKFDLDKRYDKSRWYI